MMKKKMTYWDNITEIYEKQRKKGVETYGQTLEENTELDYKQRITMAQEELVDLLVYLEHIKAKGCACCCDDGK